MNRQDLTGKCHVTGPSAVLNAERIVRTRKGPPPGLLIQFPNGWSMHICTNAMTLSRFDKAEPGVEVELRACIDFRSLKEGGDVVGHDVTGQFSRFRRAQAGSGKRSATKQAYFCKLLEGRGVSPSIFAALPEDSVYTDAMVVRNTSAGTGIASCIFS